MPGQEHERKSGLRDIAEIAYGSVRGGARWVGYSLVADKAGVFIVEKTGSIETFGPVYVASWALLLAVGEVLPRVVNRKRS